MQLCRVFPRCILNSSKHFLLAFAYVSAYVCRHREATYFGCERAPSSSSFPDEFRLPTPFFSRDKILFLPVLGIGIKGAPASPFALWQSGSIVAKMKVLLSSVLLLTLLTLPAIGRRRRGRGKVADNNNLEYHPQTNSTRNEKRECCTTKKWGLLLLAVAFSFAFR